MTESQMRELVASTFTAAWTAAQPDVPLALDNEALPTADTFISLTITPTTGAQVTHGRTGTRRFRRNGWLQVKLWGPANQGAAGLTALADAAQGILEAVSLPSPVAGDDPVTTLAANAGPGGASTDGRWWMQVVRVPFWYRETK